MADAQRDVLFRLTSEVDPKSQKSLDQFGKSLVKQSEALHKQLKKDTTSLNKQVESLNKSMGTLVKNFDTAKTSGKKISEVTTQYKYFNAELLKAVARQKQLNAELARGAALGGRPGGGLAVAIPAAITGRRVPVRRKALGGMVEGRSHSQGGESFSVGGRLVELEGGEGVLRRSAMMSGRRFSMSGTPREIASGLNSTFGGKKFAAGGQMIHGPFAPGDPMGGSRPTDTSSIRQWASGVGTIISGIIGTRLLDTLPRIGKSLRQVGGMGFSWGGAARAGASALGGAVASPAAVAVGALTVGSDYIRSGGIPGEDKITGRLGAGIGRGAAKLGMATGLIDAGTSAANRLAAQTAMDIQNRDRIEGLINDKLKERGKLESSLNSMQRQRVSSIKSEQSRIKEMFAGRIAGMKEVIKLHQSELKEINSKVAAEQKAGLANIASKQGALMSAQERFGLMDTGQQQNLLGLLQAARSGKQLNVEQLQELQGLGTEEAGRLVSAQARKRASAAFGSGAAQGRLGQIQQQMSDLKMREQQVLKMSRSTFRLKSTADLSEAMGEKRKTGGFLYTRERDQLASIQAQQAALRAEEIRVYEQEQARQGMRFSVFGTERRAVGQAIVQHQRTTQMLQSQKSRIQANLKQEIKVEVNLERTAKELANEAVAQIIQKTQKPLHDLQIEIQDAMKQLKNLQRARQATIPGRR